MDYLISRFLIQSRKSCFVFLKLLFCFVAFCFPQSNAYASWYVGGANLNLFNHFFPGYVKIGSSEMRYTTNGISLDGGYKFRLQNFLIASEFDAGSFFDADGNITYMGNTHYINATYYLAIKQKFGYYVKPNFALYGFFGLSQNSIGDRIYATGDYFNKKQLSYLYGGGIEYFSRRFKNLSLFSELFYFAPTGRTLYSGGSREPTYTLSIRGTIFELGMRYYLDSCN